MLWSDPVRLPVVPAAYDLGKKGKGIAVQDYAPRLAVASAQGPRTLKRDLPELFDEIGILHGLCHGFGSASDLTQASDSAVWWVTVVLGARSSARIALPDRSGRLRTAASRGDPSTGGRKRSARRRLAYESKRPSRHDLRHSQGDLLALFPLVSQGEAVGVLEVAGRRLIIEERWETLEAVASQAAMVIRNARQLESLQRRVEALETAADVVRGLRSTEDIGDAVRSMVRLCHELVQTPVAAWVADPDGAGMRFLVARGVGTRKQAEIRSELPTMAGYVPNGSGGGKAGDRFAGIVGAEGATVIESAHAVILVADDPRSASGFLPVLRSLFLDALGRLGDVALAQRRSEQLDLGLAWTAHEVRAPLLGARATIDYLLEKGAQVEDRELLSQSRHELGELAGMVEALLKWAVGQEPLHGRRTDLVRVVREAVEANTPDPVRARVKMSSPLDLWLLADPRELRSAVANLVSNALAYSPSHADVEVIVEGGRDFAAVIVRDQGPGVPPEERESIFDPLIRGQAGNASRNGKGLGLFIARRVVEAHGGSISVEPSTTGTAFRIELPVGGEPCES